MVDLAGAMRAVVEQLEALDVEYVLVGSVASATWGVIRTTRDVDLVAVLTPETLEVLLRGVDRTVLYLPDNLAESAVRSGGSFNVIHYAGGGKVDVFVPLPGDRFTRSRLERKSRSEVFGVPAWVASAEDVVLAKLRWRLTSRSEVQWRDCVEIAAINDLDREYLWLWADDLGVADDLAQLLDVVDEAGS
jgi:hypothetical protein